MFDENGSSILARTSSRPTKFATLRFGTMKCSCSRSEMYYIVCSQRFIYALCLLGSTLVRGILVVESKAFRRSNSLKAPIAIVAISTIRSSTVRYALGFGSANLQMLTWSACSGYTVSLSSGRPSVEDSLSTI